MSKVRAPLLSWGAGGQIAKTQVYSNWKGRPYVRQYVVPANPNSPGQQLTRNTFRYLNRLWQYLPAGALGAWSLYATNQRYTNRNGWLSVNTGVLRSKTDLTDIILSIGAGSGIVAQAMDVVAGSGSLTVTLTAPDLPTGWTITSAWAMAVASVDPQTSDVYDAVSGSDNATPFEIVLSGLTPAQEYVVGGWFEFTKPDGKKAYGISLQDVATPTV
ncbi:hypothetical protein [Asticcacaulis sp.]|uniref:hypothetical protein n=1 Tax=Asticcacaulis sp. TaxID=1872648 RepID=UPI002C56C2DF|nr:hypothetical protein [Asticcacaulis sp.]HTM83281.1 hypothetical protein [Asticcacaulis sp.]